LEPPKKSQFQSIEELFLTRVAAAIFSARKEKWKCQLEFFQNASNWLDGALSHAL